MKVNLASKRNTQKSFVNKSALKENYFQRMRRAVSQRARAESSVASAALNWILYHWHTILSHKILFHIIDFPAPLNQIFVKHRVHLCTCSPARCVCLIPDQVEYFCFASVEPVIKCDGDSGLMSNWSPISLQTDRHDCSCRSVFVLLLYRTSDVNITDVGFSLNVWSDFWRKEVFFIQSM